MDFSKYQTFVFDLDGTLWNNKKLLPGAAETIENLGKAGKQVIFYFKSHNHSATVSSEETAETRTSYS